MSCLFLLTASRMRACACDTAARLCVRTVLCSSAFSLVPPLRSASSAAAEAALFARFSATSGRSDFSIALIVGYGLRPSRHGPGTTAGDSDGDLPVPRWKASAHARVCDDAGLVRISQSRHAPFRLLLDGKHRRPELVLRRSIPSLRTPLSTLRLQPHGHTRITRGRCGLLRLHRNGLAPSTFRRSPGAPVHT